MPNMVATARGPAATEKTARYYSQEPMLNVRQQLFKNVFSSWFAYLVRITITFFFVPYITGVLGDARYGVWVIIFQTIFFFSLLDLGLTSALTRYISKFLAEHDFDRINRVLNTANLMYFVVGLVAFAGIYGFMELFFGYFRISDPTLLTEGKHALLILGGYMAFNFIALPFGNTLGSFHRYDIVNALNIGEEIIRTLLMVYMLWQGHGLVALALVIVLLTVMKHLVAAAILLKIHPEVDIQPQLADRATASMLFSYSRISVGISLCWLIIFNTDAILLGLMGTATAAGIYYPGAQLMRYLRNLINAVALPLIPAVSHEESTGQLERVQRLYLKAVRYVAYFSFAITAAILVYAPDFVKLWLPEEFFEATQVMQVLAVGTMFLLPQVIGNAILFGIEQHRKLLIVLAVESVLKLGLAFWLIRDYGLLGMAFAVAAPQVLLFNTLYPILVARVLGTTYWRIMRTVAFAGGTAFVITAASAFFAHWAVEPSTWTRFFVSGAIVVIIAAVGLWPAAASEDRAWLKAWFE